MARPREFDEETALEAAMECFWSRGYEATTFRDLIEKTGLTGASLCNAFGDKRALYGRVFDRYVEASVADRIRRCEALPPREAIGAFFSEIIKRSLADSERKGCMLVNAALDVAPHDEQFREVVTGALGRIEAFFNACIARGQADGTITAMMPAFVLAKNLLGVLIGVRVLARVRPERQVLEGVVAPVLLLLDGKISGTPRDFL